MANGTHKGTELNNVNETWNENEKRLAEGNATGKEINTSDAGAVGDALDQVIKDEAAEYDNANKEERILGGERATLNDEVDEDDTKE